MSFVPPGVDWDALFKKRLIEQARGGLSSVTASRTAPAGVQAQMAKLAQPKPVSSSAANAAILASKGYGGNPQTGLQQQVGTINSASGGGGSSGGGSAAPASTAAASKSYPKEAKDNTFGFDAKKNPVLRNGKIADSRNWFAGKNSNIAIQDLASDPEQINYQWANSQGYGRGIEGQLNRYVDPYAVGLAMGNNFATDEDYLGFVGGFNERAVSGSSGQSTFDPRAILKRVFGASGEVNTDPNVKGDGTSNMDIIGQKLFGGQNATNVSGQVGDTLKFLQSSLTGVMSPVVLDAYLNLIEEQGRAFLQYKNSPEGGKTPTNFGNWILSRLGPNGGL